MSDPLQELAASWASFGSGLAWAAWCEEDRASELAEMLDDVRSEQVEAAAFESKFCVDPLAQVVELPRQIRKVRRSAA